VIHITKTEYEEYVEARDDLIKRGILLTDGKKGRTMKLWLNPDMPAQALEDLYTELPEAFALVMKLRELQKSK
jgi:hypothetical protein